MSEWMFPDLATCPSPSTYAPLITGAAVEDLMNSVPPMWGEMYSEFIPLTFMPAFMPPGFCDGGDRGTIADALKTVDLQNPRRNQFRHYPGDLPATRIARLKDKFVPPARGPRSSISDAVVTEPLQRNFSVVFLTLI